MNPENRNQIIILVVLAIVLLGVVYMYFIRPTMASGGSGGGGDATSDGRIAAIADNVETAFVQDDVNIDELLKNVQDVRFVYAEKNLARNPMIPLVGQTVMNPTDGQARTESMGAIPDDELLYLAEGLEFTGIIWDAKFPLAIVDNELVHVGYKFDITNIAVKSINEDEVVVEVPLSTGPEIIVHGLKESTLNE